jgi:hypothetical protein
VRRYYAHGPDLARPNRLPLGWQPTAESVRGGGHWPVDPENASDKGGGWGRHPRARGGGGEPISGGSGVRSSPDEVLLGGTRGQKGNQRQELGS